MAKSIEQYMAEDPCGTDCSVCGNPSGAVKGARASVCATCTYKLSQTYASSAAEQQAGEKQAAQAARASRVNIPDAAYEILAEAGKPMKNDVLTKAMLAKGHWTSRGATPSASVYAGILMDMRGPNSRFVRTAPNTWGLKENEQPQ